MTLFEWMTCVNTATLTCWIIVNVRRWQMDRHDLDERVLSMMDNYPAGIKKLAFRMGWTEEQMNEFIAAARERTKK
jgi:hypothetical protein